MDCVIEVEAGLGGMITGVVLATGGGGDANVEGTVANAAATAFCTTGDVVILVFVVTWIVECGGGVMKTGLEDVEIVV